MYTMQINIEEVRQRFSELINTVGHKKERVIITSRNKPKKVLVSIQGAETIQKGLDQEGSQENVVGIY